MYHSCDNGDGIHWGEKICGWSVNGGEDLELLGCELDKLDVLEVTVENGDVSCFLLKFGALMAPLIDKCYISFVNRKPPLSWCSHMCVFQ